MSTDGSADSDSIKTLPNGLIDIAEVCRVSGLTASALRFYERRGLVAPSDRNGQRRAYQPDVFARLDLVACSQQAGFTIAEIGRFLEATPSDDELRQRLSDKASELSRDIRRLQRMRDSLDHAATCTHTPLVDCPRFKDTITEDAVGSRRTAARPSRPSRLT